MISNRQQQILNALIEEYIDSASPISSDLLKKKYHLEVSPATIRNELQDLTLQGYITQPHTSAGRVPTHKGYRYFIEITFTQKPEITDVILKEIETARQKITQEIALAQRLLRALTQISATLEYAKLQDTESALAILEILGPSRMSHEKNIDVMKELLKEFEGF